MLDIYFRDYICFTQGFLFDEDKNALVESCGEFKASKTVRSIIDEANYYVEPELETLYNAHYFGEGIALLNQNQYLALTWQNNKVMIIDRETLHI